MAISDPVSLALAVFNVSDPHGCLFGSTEQWCASYAPFTGQDSTGQRDVVAAGERGEHVAGCPQVLSTVGKQP